VLEFVAQPGVVCCPALLSDSRAGDFVPELLIGPREAVETEAAGEEG